MEIVGFCFLFFFKSLAANFHHCSSLTLVTVSLHEPLCMLGPVWVYFGLFGLASWTGTAIDDDKLPRERKTTSVQGWRWCKQRPADVALAEAARHGDVLSEAVTCCPQAQSFVGLSCHNILHFAREDTVIKVFTRYQGLCVLKAVIRVWLKNVLVELDILVAMKTYKSYQVVTSCQGKLAIKSAQSVLLPSLKK